MSEPTIIKKYGNRRLYDTDTSRYITLEALAKKIQDGVDVRVIGAKSGEDLTRGTLTQIMVEGRGLSRVLSVSLLTQLIRLGDDALGEFFGQYVTSALQMYLAAKRGTDAMASYNPFAAVPVSATNALTRMWMDAAGFGASHAPDAHAPDAPEDAPDAPEDAPDAPEDAPDAPTWDPAPAPDGLDAPTWDPAPTENFSAPSEPAPDRTGDPEVAELRREIEQLKRAVRHARQPRQRRKRKRT